MISLMIRASCVEYISGCGFIRRYIYSSQNTFTSCNIERLLSKCTFNVSIVEATYGLPYCTKQHLQAHVPLGPGVNSQNLVYTCYSGGQVYVLSGSIGPTGWPDDATYILTTIQNTTLCTALVIGNILVKPGVYTMELYLHSI